MLRRTALATRRGAPVNSTLGVAIHSVPYRLLADTVLVTHLAFVVFVVGGLVCIFVGNIARVWPWVNSVGFRSAHLGAIGVVGNQLPERLADINAVLNGLPPAMADALLTRFFNDLNHRG